MRRDTGALLGFEQVELIFAQRVGIGTIEAIQRTLEPTPKRCNIVGIGLATR
jgi:hypothetical protein